MRLAFRGSTALDKPAAVKKKEGHRQRHLISTVQGTALHVRRNQTVWLVGGFNVGASCVLCHFGSGYTYIKMFVSCFGSQHTSWSDLFVLPTEPVETAVPFTMVAVLVAMLAVPAMYAAQAPVVAAFKCV